MKNPLFALLLISITFLSSCNPKVSTKLSKSYPAISNKQEVIIIDKKESKPDSSEILGVVKIGDTGFTTNCSLDTVLNRAKLEARKAGGNAIKINEIKPPSTLGSSCYRISATILKINKIEENLAQIEKDTTLAVDYAILNVYRINGIGPLINFNLHLGDSIVWRVKKNQKTTIHINPNSGNILWAKTESKSELRIDFQAGKTYYVNCKVTIGIFVGRPKLELVENKIGEIEFDAVNSKKD